MARWQGWGAGPAGAGSTGGPSRAFLAAMVLGTIVVTAALASDGNLAGAAVTALAAVYFALRLFGVVGR